MVWKDRGAALLKESTTANFSPTSRWGLHKQTWESWWSLWRTGNPRSAVFIRPQIYSIYGSVGDDNKCSSFVLKIRYQDVEFN
jgi:hypothetical protein